MRVGRKVCLTTVMPLLVLTAAIFWLSKAPAVLESSGAVAAIDSHKFPPLTSAERELERLLSQPNTVLDLSLINWLMTADLPEFHDFTREDYFRRLDALIEHVRQHMDRMQSVAVARGENLQNPKTRCGIFCNAMIRLGFAYSEEFRQEKITPQSMKSLYADANHISLAGLLRTGRGSCVSMPLIYLVIGQRLRMPVHLVAVGKHYFIRWEEPGYRLNIETTIVDRVSVTAEDDVYLEIEGMTREQLRGSELHNLSLREVVGNLFFARSAYWATKGPNCSQRRCRDLYLARQLAPDDDGIQRTTQRVLRQGGFKSDRSSMSPETKIAKGTSL
jgi:Transglutaminase-like superfamily